MKTKPDLSFWKLWNLSFGFFGVQIAYALQSANVSRIFTTIGADPHDLSYFWILPPLRGVFCRSGSMCGRTSCRLSVAREAPSGEDLLMWLGMQNVAPAGVVPDTVIWSFYLGAAILLICVIYSLVKVKEWSPKVYNEYNGVPENKEKGSGNVITLLRKAPSTFWSVGSVQFFCWFAFLFLWTYATNTIAHNAFSTPTVETITGIRCNGTDYNAKYLIANDTIILIDHGKKTSDFLASAKGAFVLTTADIVVKNPDGTLDTNDATSHRIENAADCSFVSKTVLDASSPQYNDAGNWLGLLFAVQASDKHECHEKQPLVSEECSHNKSGSP